MVESFFYPNIDKLPVSDEAFCKNTRDATYLKTSVYIRLSDRRVNDQIIIDVNQSVERIPNGLDHVVVINGDGGTIVIVDNNDLYGSGDWQGSGGPSFDCLCPNEPFPVL